MERTKKVAFKGKLSLWTALWLVFVCMLMSLTACDEKDDTQAVRELIRRGAELAQKHAVGDIMELTTQDFSASPGTHNANEVKKILFLAFRHYGNFKIHYPRPSVSFDRGEGRARSVLYFVILRQDRALPELKEFYQNPERWVEEAREKADLYQLQLDLLKAGGDWKIQKARLEGFKGYGF